MPKQKQVLIAEDERPLSHALELKLQHEGFATAVARNGQECIDLMSARHFDVVLLDMMMPVLDGFRVLERMQKLPGEMPVVFVLSNLSLHDDQDRVLTMGAKKFFIKSDTSLSVIVDEVKKA